MNDKHNKTKRNLKIAGFIFLITGLILTVIGFISFISTFEYGDSSLFWFIFIGFPCIGIGGSLLTMGYHQEIQKYVKNENIPIMKETYSDMKPEFKDMVNTIKDKNDDVMICSHCGTPNDRYHRFCQKCGNELNRTCPKCNQKVQSEYDYCPYCGNKLM